MKYGAENHEWECLAHGSQLATCFSGIMKRKTANFVGICATTITVLFWLLLLTPIGRSHGFTGDIFVIKAVVALAFVGCAVAALRGSPWWWIAFAVSLVTAILVVLIAPV
ncbi:MAG: hypothetical protein LAO78_29065 [Acidobacteriia bacterium]|nr:hypothetical protein [Terriglobia bacterium]